MKHKILGLTTVLFSIVAFTAVFYFVQTNYNQKPQANFLDHSLFSAAKNNTWESFSKEEIKILFVGDVMLARGIGDAINSGDNPFKYVKDKFSEYDYVVANLECVVADQGRKQNKKYTFRAPEISTKILKENHIDFVSLANNHVMDYGEQGLLDMIENLEKEDIGYFGAGKNTSEAFSPLTIKHFDTTIDLFGYNNREVYITNSSDSSPGAASFDDNLVAESLQRSKSDLQIPFVHWGVEYSPQESRTQVNFAKNMINNGADYIVGGHPHIIQPTKEISGIFVTYSLGDFVFDQMPAVSKESNMLAITIQDKEISSYELIPVRIDAQGFPRLK